MLTLRATMLGRLLPQSGRFFELFNAHAEQVAIAASQLAALMKDFERRDEYARAIDAAEHAADRITEESIRLLNSTFITPLDREQIHRLVSALDDVCDLIQDTTESLTLYDVRAITPEIERLAEIAVRCCERVRDVIGLIDKPESANDLLRTCEQIDRLESDADRAMRSAMSRLFREEEDVRELVKMKTIYELLESITDRCEDVANLAEGFVLQSS